MLSLYSTTVRTLAGVVWRATAQRRELRVFLGQCRILLGYKAPSRNEAEGEMSNLLEHLKEMKSQAELVDAWQKAFDVAIRLCTKKDTVIADLQQNIRRRSHPVCIIEWFACSTPREI
jgi:hypothetical protein